MYTHTHTYIHVCMDAKSLQSYLTLWNPTACSTRQDPLSRIISWSLPKFTYMHECSVASAVSDSERPHGLQPARLLCPWGSPGKNTRVGCHFLLQGIFQTQGLNLCLLYWQGDSLPLSCLGSPLDLFNSRLLPKRKLYIT